MQEVFIDIHTHSEQTPPPGSMAIRNIRLRHPYPTIPDQDFFTIGLHPWDTDEMSIDFDYLTKIAGMPNCLGIGECGIDRLRGTDFHRQADIFKQQVLFAEQVKKPVFIHCVRAWLEIMKIKSEVSTTVPWIIHGYRGKASTALQLIDKGFYLSFGESILSMNQVLSDILRKTPEDRLFLETDDGKHSIQEIYQAASEIKNIPLAILKDILNLNFNKVFKINGPSGMAAKD